MASPAAVWQCGDSAEGVGRQEAQYDAKSGIANLNLMMERNAPAFSQARFSDLAVLLYRVLENDPLTRFGSAQSEIFIVGEMMVETYDADCCKEVSYAPLAEAVLEVLKANCYKMPVFEMVRRARSKEEIRIVTQVMLYKLYCKLPEKTNDYKKILFELLSTYTYNKAISQTPPPSPLTMPCRLQKKFPGGFELYFRPEFVRHINSCFVQSRKRASRATDYSDLD